MYRKSKVSPISSLYQPPLPTYFKIWRRVYEKIFLCKLRYFSVKRIKKEYCGNIFLKKSYVLCSAVCCPLNCLVCGTQSWLHVKTVGSEQVELIHRALKCRSAIKFLLFLSQTNHSVCFSLFSSLSSQVSVHTTDLHVFSGLGGSQILSLLASKHSVKEAHFSVYVFWVCPTCNPPGLGMPLYSPGRAGGGSQGQDHVVPVTRSPG